MPQLKKTKGIVLERHFLKEADGIARMLTVDGACLEFYAYGIRLARKRSALLIEPGTLISINYYDGHKNNIASLKEGIVKERFDIIKNDYTSIIYLSNFLELASFASRYGSLPPLFLLLRGAIEELSFCYKNINSIMELSIFFQIRLLKMLGILGEQNRCYICDKALKLLAYWNMPEASFACENCNSNGDKSQAWMARTIAMAAKMRFKNFSVQTKGVKENTAYLSLWKNLNLCLEAFKGSPLRTSIVTEKQLEMSLA